MKPEISIILPAIRKHNWDNLYNSIVMSTARSFELIICGPYGLTEYLESKQNVKYVRDFGSPTRASVLASLVAEGKLITWLTDDAVLMRDAMDNAVNVLYSMGDHYKNVVITKYIEGAPGAQKVHQPDYYYKINGREGFRPCTYSQYLPDEWWIFNTAIMYRSFFEELGGLDCNFEHVAIADTDFAIRAQTAGANVKITQILMYDCDHGQPDHKPVEIAQLRFDEPLIQSKYRDPDWKEKLLINIDINNWKSFPSVWARRFKMEKLK